MTIVIVGAGQAGATAAAHLREIGSTEPVILFGREDEPPYERPPLSKGYLQGGDDEFVAIEIPGDVDVRTGVEVTGVDVDARTVTAAGETVAWDSLLIATGVEPAVPDFPGADKATYLRTHADSDALRRSLHDASKVVVVGASWLGMEVAAAAREAGCEVVLISDGPTVSKLGPEIGAIYAAVHREHGVDVRTDTTVTEVLTDGDRVTGVAVEGGDPITGDVVVIATGSSLNLDVAKAAGVEIDEATGGVAVDGSLRTSVPGVWAVGDIAAIDNPVTGKRARVEHWALALDGAKVAARSIAGQADAAVDFLPFFFSDQYDFSMEIAGGANPDATVVFRGSTEAPREFVAFWQMADGKVVAAMNANVWDVTETLQALIKSGRSVDRARLEDPAVPLADL